MTSVTLLIPALNEERRIGATLDTVLSVCRGLPQIRPEILVVDDGSRDATPAVVAEYARRHPEVRLVQHPTNLGLGQAFRTGLAQATAEKIMIVPGDNDMPAATIATLLAHAGQADLTMCFFLNREQRGRWRHLLSTTFGLAYTLCFDVFVEYINGPCVYPVARLRELTLVSTRFSIVAEINVRLLRQGASYLELPGYRQVGLDGSTSLSWRNLAETIRVFLQLLWQVHVSERARYAFRPRRVQPAAPAPADRP